MDILSKILQKENLTVLILSIRYFKSLYEDLFDENIEKRVKAYQFNYLMEQALDCKKDSWISKLLLNIKYEISKNNN